MVMLCTRIHSDLTNETNNRFHYAVKVTSEVVGSFLIQGLSSHDIGMILVLNRQ